MKKSLGSNDHLSIVLFKIDIAVYNSKPVTNVTPEDGYTVIDWSKVTGSGGYFICSGKAN